MPAMRYVFGLTIVFSAALLFWAQPMFAKQVLPLLGGSPAVWNTCMVCYQFTLLVGYAYAHWLCQRTRLHFQILLHLGVLWGVFLLLSTRIPATIPATSFPGLWVMRIFLTSIGPAFFVLTTTTPLLHAWFHASANEQRFPLTRFYAFSNFGSLAALLSYPILIEPFLQLSTQNSLWKVGYVMFAIALSGCGEWGWWRGPRVKPAPLSAEETIASVTWRQRLHWMALSAIPSGVLLAVTQYITTDVAPIPLFWVIPLSLYLLTFILVFARAMTLPNWGRQMQAALVLPVFLIVLGQLRTVIWLDMLIHLTVLWVVALACHGELVCRKPASHQMTDFYLWMSVGGLLGGMFTTFAAPVLFNTLLEYPLFVVCACLLCPPLSGRISPIVWKFFGFSVFVAFVVFPLTYLTRQRELIIAAGIGSLLLFTALGGWIGLRLLRTPRQIALGLGSFGVMALLMLHNRDTVVWRDRNFFGAMKITQTETMRIFYHGTTQHGAQYLAPERQAEALTYFHRDGPLGHLLTHLPARPARSMAVLGLGIGTIAAYVRPEDTITFYELDPQVVDVATHPQFFTYLQKCRGQLRILEGDGRLVLANAPDHAYTLIIQDAFNSDTIPVHLLTREAFALYLSKLADNGLLVFNLTNRYLDVAPVVASLIHDSGMVGVIWRDMQVKQPQQGQGHYPSIWVAAARHETDLAFASQTTGWQPLPIPSHPQIWTDGYSHLLSILKFW